MNKKIKVMLYNMPPSGYFGFNEPPNGTNIFGSLFPDSSWEPVDESSEFYDLQFDLCVGCGERQPDGMIAIMQHKCPINVILYRVHTNLSLNKLFQNILGNNPVENLKKELLQFEHFKRIPNYYTATWIERNSYRLARESDIRTMKRLRAYLELEDEFDHKY